MDDAGGFGTSGDYDGDPAPRSEGAGLRRQLEEVLRKNAELENRLNTELPEAEQRGARSAERRFQARETFGALGYPNLGDLWVKEHPEGEPNPEIASEFLSGLGISPPDTKQPEPVSDEVKDTVQAFNQPVPSHSTAIGMIERADYVEMLKDPARRSEAKTALKEGRVRLNNPEANWWENPA